MRLKGAYIPIILFAILLPFLCKAQISKGGNPLGFDPIRHQVRPIEVLPILTVPAPDMDLVHAQDSRMPGTNRFAAPIEVNMDLNSHGEWENLPEGGRVWRLRLQVQDALGLFFLFNDFHLPSGASFYLYSPDRKQVLGGYTSRNNQIGRKFMAGMILGEEAVLEYFEPELFKNFGGIELSKIMFAYNRDRMESPDYPFQVYDGRGFGDALPCNININCPQAGDVQEQKKGVARIVRVFEEGIGWCSGSLINNTEEDGFPYLLSAHHCIVGYTPIYELWRFDFHFEFPGCSNQTTQPGFFSVLGCEPVSTREESDFLLLQLPGGIPYSFSPQFNGWNRSPTATPSNSTLIHHPVGDAKKYSHDPDKALIFPNSINWNNGIITPPNHHFRAVLDEGTIEGGSSGSPLFDQDGYIVAQLHGGNASCTQFITYSGRLAMSWNGGMTPETRLKDWLAPSGGSPTKLDGWIPPDTIPEVKGRILTCDGQNVAGVTVTLSGPVSDTAITDNSGFFIFENIPADTNHLISFEKNYNHKNGATTLDLVEMQKHILSVAPFTSSCQTLAADIDNSGMITAIDLAHLQKVILSKGNEFPNNTSWRFEPASFSPYNVPVHPVTLRITAIKVGDVNGDVDVTQ